MRALLWGSTFPFPLQTARGARSTPILFKDFRLYRIPVAGLPCGYRHKSADSRYWGFVPEDHIVGKPMFVFLSLDKDKGLFDGKIRFNRMFRSVDSLVN